MLATEDQDYLAVELKTFYAVPKVFFDYPRTPIEFDATRFYNVSRTPSEATLSGS
jgi:hypothetical protein